MAAPSIAGGIADRLPARESATLASLLSTAIDEGLLSALSLGVAILFISHGSKTEYGLYTLLQGLVLLSAGIQNSIFLTPMTANGARLEGEERAGFVANVSRLQAVGALIGASALGLAVLVGLGASGAGLVAAACALAVLGGWQRELRRTTAFLDRQSGRALIGDVIYVTLASTGLGVAILARGQLEASMALAAVGAAALVTGLPGLRLAPPAGSSAAERRQVRHLLASQGRWTLPGMAAIWAQNMGYAWVITLYLDTHAVADVAAARLFIVPALLLANAWTRVAVPRTGGLIARADWHGVQATGRAGLAYLGAGTGLYLLALVAFFALGGERVLPASYGDMGVLVAAWALFAVAAAARSVASNSLLAFTAFRDVFGLTTAGVVCGLGLVFALVPLLGPVGAVLGLTVGEGVLAVLTWRAFLGRCRREVADV